MSRALTVAREQRDGALVALAEAEMQLASVTACRDALIAASFRIGTPTAEGVTRHADRV